MGELLDPEEAAEAVDAADGEVAEAAVLEPVRDVGTEVARTGRRVCDGDGTEVGAADTEASWRGSRVGDGDGDGEDDTGPVTAAGGAAGTTRTGATWLPDSSSGVITAAARASTSPPPAAVRRRLRRAAPRRICSNAPGGGSRITGPDPISADSRSSRSSSGSSMGVIKVSPQPAAQ